MCCPHDSAPREIKGEIILIKMGARDRGWVQSHKAESHHFSTPAKARQKRQLKTRESLLQQSETYQIPISEPEMKYIFCKHGRFYYKRYKGMKKGTMFLKRKTA